MFGWRAPRAPYAVGTAPPPPRGAGRGDTGAGALGPLGHGQPGGQQGATVAALQAFRRAHHPRSLAMG
jgi:hypothetical protein